MRQSELQRFAEKFRIADDGCWLWTAPLNNSGYGSFKMRGKVYGAHVASYLLYRGDISIEQWVLHECDVRNCVNPQHLWLGTAVDNSLDRSKKCRVPHRKLTDDQVRELRASPESDAFLAKKFRVTPTAVWNARHRISFRWLS